MTHKIPVKRAEDKDVYHVLRLKDGTEFLLTMYVSDISYIIYIGGPESYCIQAQVNKRGTTFEKIPEFSPDVAYIHSVYYDSLCALNKPFQKGKDTRDIFLLTLSLLHTMFRYVKYVRFTDKSMKECDNGAFMSLPLMHYLQDGHTWYQHRFGAVMSSEDKTKLDNAQQKLLNKKISWDLLDSMMRTELPISKENMKRLFESSSDIFDFFHKLYHTIKASKFCIFLSPWIEHFMNTYFGFDFQGVKYTISLNNPKLLPFLEFDILRYDPSHIYENNTRTCKRSRSRRRGMWL